MIKLNSKKTTEHYYYDLREGEDKDEPSRTIEIIFENGKFSVVKFPFHGNYTREEWKILADINAKIEKIEKVNE